jgi:hypothetical protein
VKVPCNHLTPKLASLQISTEIRSKERPNIFVQKMIGGVGVW